jgi:AcrR family transcriptional regulator
MVSAWHDYWQMAPGTQVGSEISILGAGPEDRDDRLPAHRRRVAGEFERLVQAFLDDSRPGGDTLDIPTTAVAGALRNIVSAHMRAHTEDRLTPLVDDALVWLESYAVPAGQAHWSTDPRMMLTDAAPGPTVMAMAARSQRERLLCATAEVMTAEGYERTTTWKIAARAGVSREVFDEHFCDKRHALLEALQQPVQHLLETCGAAYYSAPEWPERVWSCLRALLGLIAANPAAARLRLVECYAAGPETIRRAEEITRSFTFFLEEGYGHRPQARELPRVASDAIVGAIYETIQRAVARGGIEQLPRELPQIAYLAITPFAGRRETVRLLEQLSARACVSR